MSTIHSTRPKADAVTALGEAGKIYARHAFVIVGVSVMVQTVALVATFFVMSGGGLLMTMISRVVPLTASMLLTGILTTVLLHVRETGTVPPMSELVTRALPLVPRLIGLAWLSGILVGFGLIFLVLPGVYVYVRLALAPSLMVLGRLGVMDAIRSSWHVTAGNQWSVFVLTLFSGFCTFGVAYLSYQAVGGAFAAEENVMVAEAFITALLVPIPTLAFGDLALRLSGIYPDPVTGMRMGFAGDGPAHRVHVPGGPAPVHDQRAALPQGAPAYGAAGAGPAYGAPQGAPAYAVPQAAAAYGVPRHAAAQGAHAPIPSQPQSLWNQSPQAQPAHPHFTDPPAQAYAQPQPYAQPAQPQAPQPYAPPQQPQPYAQAAQPYAQHAQPAPPHAQPAQPFAQPAPQQPFVTRGPSAPQPPYGGAPMAPPVTSPYAPAPAAGVAPTPPARPSVAPPGMG